MFCKLYLRLCLLFLCGSNIASAQNSLENQESFYEIKASPLVIFKTFKGIIIPKHLNEISASTQSWKLLTIKQSLKHGEFVKKGQVVVEFESEKLKKAILALKNKINLKDLALKKAEKNLEFTQKKMALTLEDLARRKTISANTLKFYILENAEIAKEQIALKIEGLKQSLSYQIEELKQLKKMYTDDDLIEETEEIILTRQRNKVAQLKKKFEIYQKKQKQKLQIMLLDEEKLKNRAEANALEYQKTIFSQKIALKEMKLSLEFKKTEKKELEKSFKLLSEDLKLLTIYSPANGIVFYGVWGNDVWNKIFSSNKTLKSKKISSGKRFLTVVDLKDVVIKASIPESILNTISNGQDIEIKFSSKPGKNYVEKIFNISTIPKSDGTYTCFVNLPKDDTMNRFPGRKCMLTLLVYKNDKALLIPMKSIKKDVDFKYYVMKKLESKTVKTFVEIGRKNGMNVEVLSGLKEHDKIKLNP